LSRFGQGFVSILQIVGDVYTTTAKSSSSKRAGQDTNGTVYGISLDGGRIAYHYYGGTCGTIYSLSVPLPPLGAELHPLRHGSGHEPGCPNTPV